MEKKIEFEYFPSKSKHSWYLSVLSGILATVFIQLYDEGE